MPTPAHQIPTPLLQGTLDLLILQVLTWGPRHGYAMVRWLESTTGGAMQIEDASLYTALHRMAAQGWVEAEWGLSEKGKRARFYRLTAKGRVQRRARASQWQAYAASVTAVLTAASGEA